MTDVPILDYRKLDELRAMLGEQAATGFIERFDTEVRTRVADLAASCNQPDQLASIAHKLVAVTGALGLIELSLECQRLSQVARVGAPDVTEGQHQRTMAAAGRATAALHAIVSDAE